MTDSRTAKNKFQQSISNPAFDTLGMVKTATAPIQASMTKSIANIMKPSLATLNAAASKPLDMLKQQQETISRMFRSPETPSIKIPRPSASLSKEQWSSPKDQWHQLIVLGNGFDLECGLHSKFSDFEESRLKLLHPSSEDLEKSDKSIAQYAHDSGLTAWDVILDDKSQYPWSDIELAIEQWVAKTNAIRESRCSKVAEILNHAAGAQVEQYLNSCSYPLSWIGTPEERVAQFLYVIGNQRAQWTSSLVSQLLLAELYKMEQAFSLYLLNEVDGNGDYAQNALDLLNQMLMTELPDEDYYDVTASLLDFNYTNPLIGADNSAESYSRKRPFPTLVNIHGSLRENNIVFGIDGTKHMDEPDALPFTKTYRLLSLDNPDTAKLIQTYSPHGLRDDSTAMIKFYGHSLAQADYAYFQAIFDGVDLYESQTRLMFFYRPWKKDDGTRVSGAEARSDMNRKVAGLLSTYGSTLDNKDHGKNLMHKLLIEGRLSVKTI
jgi:hypothetical protein